MQRVVTRRPYSEFVIDLVVGLLVGALLGAAVGFAVAGRRRAVDAAARAAAEEKARAESARSADLSGLLDRERDALQRERTAHEAALAALPDRFKAMAGDVLESTVNRFSESQKEVQEQRDARLGERLDPLEGLLKEYRDKVAELETRREQGYTTITEVARQLADAQQKSLDETQKLATVLGRSSSRGRWGEIQLERILELSQMTRYVDFDPQQTIRGEREGRRRPDVVVNLPRGATIAIDAKVPYDAYDKAMSSTDEAERSALLGEYASSLRKHVTELKSRAYFDDLKNSPDFVVCFVPSDHLLSVAFETDATLLSDAMSSNVLIAGPSTLLAMLWATAMGWRNFEAVESIDEIKKLAEELVDRTGSIYKHVRKLGSALDNSTKSYNEMVGSLEQKLLVTIRRIQTRGINAAKEIAPVEGLGQLTRPPQPSRWPSDDDVDAVDAELVDPALGSGDD